MTFGSFRALVKDYLNRTDLSDARLNSFINTAKLRLQREFGLQFAVKSFEATYQAEGIDLPSDFRSFIGDFSVDFLSNGSRSPLRGTDFGTVQRRVRAQRPSPPVAITNIEYYILPAENKLKLLLYPEIAEALLLVRYFAWLPDYVNDSEEDFILKFGHDALLWATLAVANMFLNEEDRVKIDTAVAADACRAINKIL